MVESQIALKHLMSLAQLDVDAVHAYTAAIERIDLVEVKERLTLFRGDHERHITDLAPLIERLGGETPKRTPDFKGFVIQGFTAIRSMISNESALKAMRSNEELTNRVYDEALQLELSSEIKDVIQSNCDDERIHLEYINRCIEEKVWDQPQRSVA